MNTLKILLFGFIFLYALPISAQKAQTGNASYYATKFNGRLTASGEKFSNDSLTAAHPKLPFGTFVKVTNVKNGKEVVLRVNDRGPFTKGRIIDVTQRAAKQLGFYHQGVAKVRVEVVKRQ